MWLFLDEYLDVTRGAVVSTCITLARHVYYHTFGYTCRDVYLNNFLALLNAGSVTMLTLVLDYHSLATAGRTNALLLHHTEDALSGVGDVTLTVTCGALLLLASGLGTTTVTMWAVDVLAHLEFLGNAGVYLLECQLNLKTKVASAMLLWATLSATEATETVTTEYIAEHREDVVHIHCAFESAETTESAAHVRTVESELVVLLACLWVVQNIVCLGRLLKFLLGFFVARIAVGVVLNGYLSIRFLDFVF